MTRAKRILPPFLAGTNREWKAQKRRELLAVERALHTFRMGCAYTPARDVDVPTEWVRAQRQKLSAKSWGR